MSQIIRRRTGFAADRISTSGVASGATLGMVVANMGTISFTLGGTAGAAYLHPTLGLVAPGVSTTGPISGTNGYFSGTISATYHYGQYASFTALTVGGVAVTGGGGSTSNSVLTYVVFQANGAVTPTILAQNNVSSVTRNGTADWTITFSSPLNSTNYAWSGSISNNNVNQTSYLTGPANITTSTYKTASSLRVVGEYGNASRNSDTETGVISVIIFDGTSTSGVTVAGSSGQVQFNNAGGLAADNNFYWDNANKRLGIGTSAPAYPLEVSGTISATNVYTTATTGTLSGTFVYGKAASFTALTVGGIAITSNGGTTRLASLTDVTTTGVVSGSILAYNGATTSWTALPIQQVMSTTTMITNFPDAFTCLAYNGDTWTYVLGTRASTGEAYYVHTQYSARYMEFNSNGSWNTEANGTSNCSNKTISQLYATGQAFNFIGSNLNSAATPTGSFQYSNNGTLAGSGLYYVSGTGYVGVAVTAPNAPLEVSGTTSTTTVRVAKTITLTSRTDTCATAADAGTVSVSGTGFLGVCRL